MMRLAFFLVIAGVFGCLDSRERLQPPRVYLRLDETGVAPGGELNGRVSAFDESGIVYVNAQMAIQGDTARPKSSSASGFELDSVDYDFHFTVKTGFRAGSLLFVSATIRDDQNFEVTVVDTAVIR